MFTHDDKDINHRLWEAIKKADEKEIGNILNENQANREKNLIQGLVLDANYKSNDPEWLEWSFLTYAVYHNQVPIVKLLLGEKGLYYRTPGYEVIPSGKWQGWFLLYYAEEKNLQEVAAILEEKGSLLHSLLVCLNNGAYQAGKTTLMYRFSDNSYEPDYIKHSSVGVNSPIKKYFYNGYPLKLQISDTKGEERFCSINNAYYRSCEVFIFCLSVQAPIDNNRFQYILNNITKRNKAPILLVGTMNDVLNRKFSFEEGVKIAEKYNLAGYMECSAKTGQGVKEVFLRAVALAFDFIKSRDEIAFFDSYTSLMYAVEIGDISKVKLILEDQPDLSIRCKAENSYKNKTALEIAEMLMLEKEASKNKVVNKKDEKTQANDIKNDATSFREIVTLLKFYPKILSLLNMKDKDTISQKPKADYCLDLSGEFLREDEVTYITKELAEDKTITSLKLNKCKIQDNYCKVFKSLLQTNKTLTTLDLSNNQISEFGAEYLVSGLVVNRTLTFLNLKNNYISLVRSGMLDWRKRLEKVSSSVKFDISQNQLSEECDEDFEDEKEAKQNFRCSFFYSAPCIITSQINTEKKISCDSWLVCLVCPKNNEHAMIYLEGMRSTGQVFLYRYHITSHDLIIGNARLQVDEIELKKFEKEKYYFFEHPVDQEQGRALINNILKDKNKSISFSKFFPSSSSGSVNCLAWAIQKLESINIKIDQKLLGLPSYTAQGKSCAIM